MLIKSLNRTVAKVAGKAPLRTILIVPFVVQIVGAVGLVGYLSFRNGQQAVNKVASQLRSEISDRISERIGTYLKTPHLINSTNADAIRLAQLDIKNPKSLERHFLKQIQVFDSLSRIYFSNPQGGLISVGNDERGFSVASTENFTRGNLRVQGVDSQGNYKNSLVNKPNYDSRERPFYKTARDAGRPTWSPIYVYIPSSRGLGIAASYPFYDEVGKLQGVLSSDLSLVAISEFLQNLKVSVQGKAFIIEHSGLIVASSTTELPFLSSADRQENKRLKATESKEPLIRATAQHLISEFGDLTNINTSKQLEYEIEGKRQFAQVTPFKDEFGLDWLIVVVVPEADFMGQIHANTYTTILLCAATLVVATGIGILTARWITKPILCLNTAAKEIAKGEWDKTVELKRSDEVGQLAQSFNQIAAQLQESFAALRESESRLTQFLEAVPVGVSVHDTTGKLTYANQTAKQLIGIDSLPDTKTEQLPETYHVYLSETKQLYPIEQLPVVKALSGESSTVDDMALHRPDRIIPLEVWATPIYDEMGQVAYAIVAFADITERKQAQTILADYSRTLEAQVAERTAELVDINEQLNREIAERQQVEQALRESEERFREIAGTIRQFFFVRSASSGRFLYVSPAYERMWGRTCESLYQNPESWREALHPEDRELVVMSLREQFQGNSVKREYRIIRPDGSIRWIVADISVVRDETGQLLRFVGLAEDISDRKQAEAEIIRSKDLLESIFNESADAIFLVNPETLLITDCNRRAVELFEAQSKDELLNIEGRTLQKESFTPEELSCIVEEIALNGFWSRELEYVTKKGKLFWGNLAAREIYVAGQMMHLVRVTDITERKQAELALQEREYMLRTLGDNLPNGTIYQLVHEPNGKAYFSYISAGIERLVGVKPEAVMQDISVLHNLIVEEDRLRAEQLTEDSKRNLSIFEMQMRKRTTRGDIQWSYLRSAPRRLDDGRTVWNGIEMDITPLKRAEAALKESEQFLRSIYEGIETAVFMVDVLEDGRFRYVGINPAHERMTGILSSEVSGKTPEEVLTSEMAQVVSEHYRACVEAGERITYEDCLVIKGRETWWITNLTPVRDSNERIYRIIGTCFNISDRKQIEEELRESALREQAVAHVLQKMRQTLDIDTIFSATTEELRGVLNCDRVAIYRFNSDWSGKFVAESVANGWVTLISEQNNEPYLTEDALEDENCIIKTLELENDSVQDTYLQNTKGGAYTQGTSYRVIEDIYNAGFTPCYINLLERFQARAYIMAPIFCGSKLWGLLATYQNSGSRSWSEAEISVVVQIGTQLGVALQQAQLLQQTQQQAVALELALDKLKRTQAQLIQAEKMSSLGQMVAGIAHEINNPISFIYGNLTPARHYCQDLLSLVELYQQTYPHPPLEIQKLVEEIDLDFLVEDWQKLMDSMQVGAERIREIVRSLRNFSRLDEKDLKPVDIHEGIDNTLLILQHRLRAEGDHPEIQVIKEYGQLPLVTCYASQLNQVFMNLLSNAIDALENQPCPRVITIHTQTKQEVRGKRQEEENLSPDFVVIRITDNGSGMDEDVQKKI